jgi:protein O-GlcNAc transferase
MSNAPMNRKQRRAAAKSGSLAEAHSNAGVVLAGQGRLDEAVAAFRQAIGIKPHSAEAHSNLGGALAARGRLDEAVEAYRQAIRIKPDYAEAYYNLGGALGAQGRLDEAIAAYRQAIGIKPDFGEAHYNLGIAFGSQGRLYEAVAAYRRAIEVRPDYAEAHSNLGGALARQGRLDEAVDAYGKAIGIEPDYAEAHSNLGLLLAAQGRLDEAVTAYRRAIGIKPDYAEAHSNLGNALLDQGKSDDAIAAYRQAIGIKPHFAEAHFNLGHALRGQGKSDEAIAAYRRAIGIKPDYAKAHSNLGGALFWQGKFDQAIAAYRQAIEINPDYAEAHYNLGSALAAQGRLDEAVAAYRQAIGIRPDFSQAFSGLLLCLNYDDKLTNDHIFAAHREWDERYGQRAPRFTTYSNDRDPTRRLRIGYLSPDFREHSVAWFLEPLLRGHDRQKVEVFCYAEVTRPDSVTTRLQGLADKWLVTVGLSDEGLAERIRTDGIDILVDVAGHTPGNRLLMFARKPAPVQVTWLGYPNTTGLNAIDYRLVDAVTDPAGEADAWASETLVRLEDGFLCYRGLRNAPEPTSPPCLKTGTVTFGSFNNPAKISGATFDAWAKLLRRLPEARLLLKARPFADAATRALFLAHLGARGIAEDRVELLSWLPGAAEHLALYHRVDIALDPFPYNGTTTTFEALWMGVPVITLRGHRHAGRVGASLLTQIRLTDLIANSPEEYIEIAVALAENLGRLDDLRCALRPRMAASTMCDERAFACKMEAAFRSMWQHWCVACPGISI